MVKGIENSPVPVDVIDAKFGLQKNGAKVLVADQGGGFCLAPDQTKSGHVEVYVDTGMWGKPGGLGFYPAKGGGSAAETPQGLLSHELSHAFLRGRGDTTPQGPASEIKAIRMSNPIRIDMGLRPQIE